MSPEARERSFDELARALANGSISRGRALRWMGAALVGGTLSSLGLGEAAAAPKCRPVGKRCKRNAQCCSQNCTIPAGSRTGTCQAQTNTTTTSTTTETPTTSTTETPTSTTTETPTTSTTTTPMCVGTPLTEGDCNCGFVCANGFDSLTSCQGTPFCFCTQTTEDTGFCANLNFGGLGCEQFQVCSSSSECPSGTMCVVDSCCGRQLCLPACSPTTGSVQQQATSRVSGLTPFGRRGA